MAEKTPTQIIESAYARRSIPADTVIFVSYNGPNPDLYSELRTHAMPVKVVGDARNPRTMQDAIREGYLAGMEV